jgi:hypothetical protein
MKKQFCILLFAATLSYSCSVNKQVIDNKSQIETYQQPYKVFGIGYWLPGYSILTLTDASHAYFTVKAARNDSLKIGDIYHPQQ